MNEEKKEKKEIIVLDDGIDVKTLIGPESSCCWTLLIPFRW